MVLSRPISRCLPIASRAGLVPSLTSRHLSTFRASKLLSSSPISSVPHTSKLFARSQIGLVPSSFRALTTAREKVKVLLVLYDGGKHAEEVSFILLLFYPNRHLLVRPQATNDSSGKKYADSAFSSRITRLQRSTSRKTKGHQPIARASHWAARVVRVGAVAVGEKRLH